MATFRQVKPETIIFGREVNQPDDGELGIFTSETTNVLDFTDQGKWKVHMHQSGQVFSAGAAHTFTLTMLETAPANYSGDKVEFEIVTESGPTGYYVWFDDVGNSDPTGSGTPIIADITGLSTLSGIATATAAAITAASTDVTATASGAVVTVRNHNPGAVAIPVYTDGGITATAVTFTNGDVGTSTNYKLNTMAGNLELYSYTGIVEVKAPPTTDLGVATKQYVDTKVEASASGLDPKESCRVATTVSLDANASITAPYIYDPTGGTSTKGQITATLAVSDTFTVDGVTLTSANNNTRVLIQNQNAAQVSTVVCLEENNGGFGQDSYFDLYAPNPTPGGADLLFRVWYDRNNGNNQPDVGGGTLVEVEIATSDNAIVVATATAAAITAAGGANVHFTATNVGGTSATVTITNTNDGWTEPVTDGGVATGFTFGTTTQGGGDDNGIYTTTILGTALTLGRATAFDEDTEVTANAYCFVEEGSSNADKGFVLTTNDPITVGGTAGTVQVWSVFSTTSGVTGAGESVQYEVVVFADESGAALSNASNVKIFSGEMTFLDTGNDNKIVTDAVLSETAFSITDGTNSYIIVDAKNQVLEFPQNVEIGNTTSGGKTLDFISTASGQSKITFDVDQTIALSMGEGGNNYIEFDSTGGSEEVRIMKKLVATAGVESAGGITSAGDVEITGGADLTFSGGGSGDTLLVFPDNQAEALIIQDTGTKFMTFDSTNSDEKITFHVPIEANVVCGITQVADAAHLMTTSDCIINYNTALTADRTITMVSPADFEGQTVKIIRDTAGSSEFNVIIDPGASEIDGSTSDILLKKDNDHITLTSNGVGWFIV